MGSPGVAEGVRAVRNEIARVLGARFSGQLVIKALSRLDRMQCEVAASLGIRYRLNVFNQERHSVPEYIPAVYDDERETLLVVQRGGWMPWAAIAREVAIALLPEEDPGSFAAGLKEVLASRSVDEAATILDELGFARLDTKLPETPAGGAAARILGEHDVPDGSTAPTEASPPTMLPKPQDLIVERAVREGDAPSSSPPTEPEPAPPPAGFGNDHRSTKKRGRQVLRTYVLPPASVTSESDVDQDDDPARSPVDEAGIRRVLEYETQCGRIPKEMPHKNPGFDLVC